MKNKVIVKLKNGNKYEFTKEEIIQAFEDIKNEKYELTWKEGKAYKLEYNKL